MHHESEGKISIHENINLNCAAKKSTFSSKNFFILYGLSPFGICFMLYEKQQYIQIK